MKYLVISLLSLSFLSFSSDKHPLEGYYELAQGNQMLCPSIGRLRVDEKKAAAYFGKFDQESGCLRKNLCYSFESLNQGTFEGSDEEVSGIITKAPKIGESLLTENQILSEEVISHRTLFGFYEKGLYRKIQALEKDQEILSFSIYLEQLEGGESSVLLRCFYEQKSFI